jgi:glycosyltransferase involved in cell wall biosynthesis
MQASACPAVRLKIAGVRPAFHAGFRDMAQQLGIAGQIDLLGYIPDVEMRALYRHAALFVMPSLAEGFGIPVLEAMASGTPVAASRRSAEMPRITSIPHR